MRSPVSASLPVRISVQGFGEAYPVAANVYGDGSDNPQGRAKNRRVEVVILNEVGRAGAAAPADHRSAARLSRVPAAALLPALRLSRGRQPAYPVYPSYPPGPPPPYGY